MTQRWKPNVTVAAVIEHEARFLLVEERTPDGLRLNNPAGHLDPGESLVQACVRETLEETAYTFRPEGLVGIYLSPPLPTVAAGTAGSTQASGLRPRPTYLRFSFWGELGRLDPQRKLDHGIVRTLWLGIDDIRASRQRHRSALLLQSVEDYLAGVRHPLSLLSTEGVAGITRS